MKEFDVIRLLFIAIPMGVFTACGIFWTIILTLKVKADDDVFRKLMLTYWLLGGVTGVLLATFYFFPYTFFLLNIPYSILAIYTMIVFYHFLCHVAGMKRRLDMVHYLPPALTGIGLLVFSVLQPEIWVHSGNSISMVASLVFGIIYSLLSLYEMHRLQLALVIKAGTAAAIDHKKAIPFVCEILLYPVIVIVLPLIGGENPNIAISILLMLCCIAVLVTNIPLSYVLICHYVGSPLDNTSLFESVMQPVQHALNYEQISGTQIQEQHIAKAATSKRVYRKYSNKQIKDGELVELDKKVFEAYFRKHKPFLDPKLTIVDLVEPLESNRTYISKFVNRTYGMSFSRYVNSCRLHELERLRSFPSNKGKSEASLSLKAGFGKYRNYLYVKKQFSTVIHPSTDIVHD